jgi:hypothetical protein
VNNRRRFLGCNHQQVKYDFVLHANKEHSPKFQCVLAKIWKGSGDDLQKLYYSNNKDIVKQIKKESEKEIAPGVSAIKSSHLQKPHLPCE